MPGSGKDAVATIHMHESDVYGLKDKQVSATFQQPAGQKKFQAVKSSHLS